MRSSPAECIFSINSLGLFSRAHNDLRKARKRELATLDEKSTSSGIAEPYARQKVYGKNRGKEGVTHVTTACPEEAGKEKCEEKMETST